MNFIELNDNDRQELLKFPAYITLLAVSAHGALDNREKKEAIKFSHIKTFSCDPVLKDFYKYADKEFLANVEYIDKHLPDNAQERVHIIRQRLSELEKILEKMDKRFAIVLNKSMKQFKNHVSHAHRNVLEYFLFPLPIEGISD